eukprot:TRINITY_DN64423_c0_g1_i1.p1 TRINITY_DN64423_c0_g1~~TRINITY_DN64423_c0_g1_i1.p1  ORF type:complete len:208 (+),score=43.67 TRINITY_DN64423_c0_g1_i1:370-993(+)
MERLGEKCMSDLYVRLLSVWPPGEKVGYHGILDMFKEISASDHFSTVGPELDSFWSRKFLQSGFSRIWDKAVPLGSTLPIQSLAEVSLMDAQLAEVAEAVRQCPEILHAEPTVTGGVAQDLSGRFCTVWMNLFEKYVSRGRAALQAYSLILQYGQKFSEDFRAGREQAQALKLAWKDSGGLGDWEAFSQKCKDMSAFTEEGLAELAG